jgi:hypothetical protein
MFFISNTFWILAREKGQLVDSDHLLDFRDDFLQALADARPQIRILSQQAQNLARIFGEKEVSSARTSSPDLTRWSGRTARDWSTRFKYRRVAFELLTRRISAKNTFADDSCGKYPSQL